MAFYDEDSGGLGGLGGGLNNFLTNPLLLASLQMMSNNSPRVGQPVNTLDGVPQLLFTAATKKKQDDEKRKAQKDLETLFGALNSESKISEPPKPIPPPRETSPQQQSSAALPQQAAGFSPPDQSSAAPYDTAVNAMDLGTPAQAAPPAVKAPPATENPPLSWLNLPESVQLGLGIKPQASAQQPTAPDNLDQRISESAQRLSGQQAPAAQQEIPIPKPTVTDKAAAVYAQNQAPNAALDAPPKPPAQAPAPPMAAPQSTPQPTVTDRAAAAYAQNRALASPTTPVAQRTDPKLLARVLANPNVDPSMKAMLLKQSSPEYSFHTQPDGTIVRMNPKTGAAEPVYQGGLKPTWGEIRTDPYTGQKVMGWIDPGNRTTTEYKPPQDSSSATVGQDGLLPGNNVEERLQAVPAEARNTIKAMLDARQPPPSSFAMKQPYWQTMLRIAQQVDPNFDQATWQTRAAEAKSLSSSGKAGQSISSANTLVNHLGGLDEAIDKLGNTNYQWVNKPWQMVKGAAGDTEFQKARANFETKKKAVTDELVRLMRGSPGAASDIKSWTETLDGAKSPEELHTAVGSVVDLMRGRIEALTNTHNKAFGKDEPPDSFLSEKSREVINKIEERRLGAGEKSKYGSAPKIKSESDYTKIKRGEQYVDPDGNLRTKQ